MKKIIALRGVKDVGKSSTIRKVYELLKEKYNCQKYNYQCVECQIDRVDIVVVIIINGVKVGIESQGDPNGRLVKKSIKHFVEIGCQVIICATRTKMGTVEAVNKLKNEYAIKWLNQDVKSSATEYETSNHAMAQKIISEAEEVICA